jgi:hypothetical protein
MTRTLDVTGLRCPMTWVRTKLERGTVVEMAREGLIVGLKDSSGDEGNFRLLAGETRSLPGFSLFTGSELLVDVALMTGAHGSVPGLGNVDPAGYVRIYEAVRAGDLASARAEQERLLRLFSVISAGTPGPLLGHAAGRETHVRDAVQVRGGVENVGAPDHKLVRHVRPGIHHAATLSATPVASARTACRTAMPEATCTDIREESESTALPEISTPRLTGPGCITRAPLLR